MWATQSVHRGFVNLSKLNPRCSLLIARNSYATDEDGVSDSRYVDEEFRVLELIPKSEDLRGPRRAPAAYRRNIAGPRANRMSTKQDWTAVWPAARVFHPAVVPLPLHMGYVKKPDVRAPPGKFANLELMKIPNFLHLTPPAIKQQCKALKKFCTKWPEELKTDEDCYEHFPLEFVFTDYVHAAPTIRDPRARIVTMRIKLSALPLDYHAKDKLRRLLNVNVHRYNEKTDTITIVADRCPLKRQNYDYIHYLLTAVYFEAWKRESWEDEIEQTDWERFYWEKSPSLQKLVSYLKEVSPDGIEDDSQLLERSEVKMYADAVTDLYDKGESEDTLTKYKESVEKLLFGIVAPEMDPIKGNEPEPVRENDKAE